MVKTLELLRKKDLHPEVGVPKSTVADWIEDFNVYIPKTKQGSRIYYRPETIDVLKFIKQCREQDYNKAQIFEMLAEKDFPITVQEAVEDVKKAIEGDTPRDTLLAVMQTTGQAVAKIADQEEEIRELREEQDGQKELVKTLQDKGNEQNERIEKVEKRSEEMDYLKQEIEALKKELAATKENDKKGFFQKLFGK